MISSSGYSKEAISSELKNNRNNESLSFHLPVKGSQLCFLKNLVYTLNSLMATALGSSTSSITSWRQSEAPAWFKSELDVLSDLKTISVINNKAMKLIASLSKYYSKTEN